MFTGSAVADDDAAAHNVGRVALMRLVERQVFLFRACGEANQGTAVIQCRVVLTADGYLLSASTFAGRHFEPVDIRLGLPWLVRSNQYRMLTASVVISDGLWA